MGLMVSLGSPGAPGRVRLNTAPPPATADTRVVLGQNTLVNKVVNAEAGIGGPCGWTVRGCSLDIPSTEEARSSGWEALYLDGPLHAASSRGWAQTTFWASEGAHSHSGAERLLPSLPSPSGPWARLYHPHLPPHGSWPVSPQPLEFSVTKCMACLLRAWHFLCLRYRSE